MIPEIVLGIALVVSISSTVLFAVLFRRQSEHWANVLDQRDVMLRDAFDRFMARDYGQFRDYKMTEGAKGGYEVPTAPVPSQIDDGGWRPEWYPEEPEGVSPSQAAREDGL